MPRTRPEPAPPSSIDVAVGIVCRAGRVLVTRRPAGTHLAGLWEFPGGKCRPGESVEDALRRELAEEVGLAGLRPRLLLREVHRYAERVVRLAFFIVESPPRGVAEPVAREGQALCWVDAAGLRALEMPAANRRVVELVLEQIAD